MTAAKKDSVRLRMEISYIGPEGALSDLSKPASFLFVLGHDTNGRSSKAIFHGALAKRLRDDMVKALDGSDLKTRRPAIEVVGEWGFAKEPRKKGGEIVNDAFGKPVHERQFEAKAAATLLSGPPLEVFRSQRAAMRHLKTSAALGAEVDAAEKAGDLATALAKAKEASAGLISFLEALAKRGGTTAAPGDEYQAAVAAATEGATNESLSEAAPALEPEVARPIPDTAETAPVVKPASEPAAAPHAETSPGSGETEASPRPKPAVPRMGAFARPRPVAQIAAATEAARTEQVKPASVATAGPEATDAQLALVDTAQATVQPQIDPEAAALTRFAKAGKEFVDAEATAPALVADAVAETADKEPPPPPTERPVPQPPSEAPPPPPVERPVPQPPSEGQRPAPPRRMGFPSMRR
jgi:hypothetical protein